MSGMFLAIASVMSLFAIAIVAAPLLPTRRKRDQGFANLPILSVIFVIIFAVGMYLALGRPDAAVSQADTHADPRTVNDTSTARTKPKNIPSVASMVEGLAARLEREPDDAGGWLLLAKSYQHLDRLDDARMAYARAKDLGRSDISLEVALDTGSSADHAAVEIRGRVSIAAGAADSVRSTDTVFVVAKAVGGSPMPLAVIRRSASDLPFDFVLDDESAMVKGKGLSTADQVVVSAKLSRSGDALQIEPGYEVHSGPVDAQDTAFLNLQIDPAADGAAIGNQQADTAL